MSENAQIDIILRIKMEQAARDARQVQTFLAKMGRQAQQTGNQGASGIDRLERAIQDLHYSTVAGFDAMSQANQQFDDGLKRTGKDTETLMKSYVDYQALAQDLAFSAGQIGAMGEDAARRRDLAESFDVLADRAGLSGDKIVAAMQKASKGTVDANTIMATSNMVLGAKFDTSSKDMARMMEFARLKSKQYGVTVTSAFQRMTLGAVKAEVEFLDEYGITIKLNDALEMYAKKLGKAKSQLKATERSQALWNALLIQADEQLADFPDGVDKNTDAYERMRLKVLNATQAMGEFLDKSKIGPVMSVASQAVQGLAAVMTPMLLMKQMAAKASMAHAQALTAETAALAAQATTMSAGNAALVQRAVAARTAQSGGVGRLAGRVAGKIPVSKAGLAAAAPAAAAMGVAVGALVVTYKKYQDVENKVKAGNEQAASSWDKHEASLRKMVDEEKSASEIAKEYARARAGVSDAFHEDGSAMADVARAMVRNKVDENALINTKREEAKQILYLASDAYPEYIRAIRDLNQDLPKGALATLAMSQSTFELKKRLAEVGKEVDDVRDKTRLYVAELEKMSAGGGLMGDLAGMAVKLGDPMIEKQTASLRSLGGEAGKIATDVLQNMGLDADMLKDKMDELNKTVDVTKMEAKAADAEFRLLVEGFGLGVIGAERFEEAVKQADKGLLELTETERAAIVAMKEQREAALSLSDATQALSSMSSVYGVDAEHMRKAQEALSVSMGETSYRQIENRKELDLLAQGLALNTVAQDRYEKAMRESIDGVITLSAAEREAIATANLRTQSVALEAEHLKELQQIATGYQDQMTDATSQFEATQEQSARAHAQRKEDIERQHQQRVAEIMHQYEKSKFAAAIARDAVAMLQARETRDEGLADAERTRAEGQAGEDESFGETNRAAVESYDARVAEIDAARTAEMAKVRALQAEDMAALQQQQIDQVAEIAEAQRLQTEVKAQEAWKQQADARTKRNQDAVEENEAFLQKVQAESSLTTNVYDNNALRLANAQQTTQAIVQTWQDAYTQIAGLFGGGAASRPTPRPRPGGRGRGPHGSNQASGGEGMVTGPATFNVGAGEREFVHFSGDQRQMVPASNMNVGGDVNMNVTTQMGQLVGPLAEKIAELLLPKFDSLLADEITEAMQ